MADQYTHDHIDATHELSEFACGVESLDRWLRNNALSSQNGGAAATYVWTEPGSQAVVAYFSVSPTQLVRADEVATNRKQAGSFPILPGYLIGKLALDRSIQGQGLGTHLLLNALETCARAAELGSGRLIVVDPLDEQVAGFYGRHGFLPTGVGLRMFMKIATARQLLDL